MSRWNASRVAIPMCVRQRVPARSMKNVTGRPQTGPYNLFGFPAMAAPSGFSADGLPVSVQFVGPPWEEARVLQASHAFEEATPDIRREKPPMFGG